MGSASVGRASTVARYVLAQIVASGAASLAFGDTTRFISFVADDAGYFLISAAGTIAQATDHRFAAGERVECIVYKGEKLSVLLDGGGNAQVSELA